MDCRLNRSQEWATRCVHEAQLHKENCFITLTYADKHLPKDGSLNRDDLTQFFKRMRYHKGPYKYYACGEYGDQTQRAHYHACIFGLDFNDKKHFRTIGEHHLYTSNTLNRMWGKGNTSIGALTFQTAAYTARYVTKKTFGKGCQRYVQLDETTGELLPLEQPYAVMSNGGGRKADIGFPRGAIAEQWIRKYNQDIYGANKDFIVQKGRKIKPPKYYDKIYDTINTEHLEEIKKQRIEKHEKETQQTQRARAKITHARIISRTQI